MYDQEAEPRLAAHSRFLRGVAHRESGELADAVEQFELSLSLTPDGRDARTAHRHLSELYELLGDSDKAAEHAKKAR